MAGAVGRAAGIERREAMLSALGGFVVFVAFMGACANVMEVATFGGLAPGILFFSLDL